MIYFVSNQTRMQSSFTSATISDVIEFCSSLDEIGVDTETTGFDYLKGYIIMLQIGNADKQFIIDARNTDILPLKPILESRTIKKILQNVKFDYKFFRTAGIVLENVKDTMLQEQVLVNGKQSEGFGLDDLVKKYIGIDLDKSTRSEFCQLGQKEFTDKQIIYGAKDVEYLIPISHAQDSEASKYDLIKVFHLENSAALAIADISYNGMSLNRDAWLKIASKSKMEMYRLEKELDTLILSDKELKSKFQLQAVQQDLFMPIEQIRKVGVKWSSPSQVLEVMNELLPGIESVNANQLFPYRYDHDIIDTYISYKEAAKRANAYGEDFLDYIRSDGRIHTDFRQILVTGRLSSSDPNMQQIPADNIYRNCFEPGIPDWVFVSGDYVSQELCLIAHASQDPVWLKALQSGQDLHSVCAEFVFGNEWKEAAEADCVFYEANSKQKCECKEHKKLRQSVKTINFGLAYGMSEVKLSNTLQITVEDASKLIHKYFTSFPRIKFYLNSSGFFGKTHGYIRTLRPWGRMRWFPAWRGNQTDFTELSSIERESKNSPIQGAGADMVKYALIQIRKYIRDNNVPVKIVMQVHDQIDTICHKDYAVEWRNVLTDLMEKAALYTIPTGLLKADVKISLVWEK